MPEEEAWKTEKSSNGGAELQMGASTEPLDADIVSGRDELCGLGSWRPACLQRLANHRVYVVAYVIIGVVQGMIMAYFGGVLTTLEKVFGIRSSMMGLVLSGNDISQILGGFFVNHFGNRGSRPVWLSIGMLTTGASCLMYAATHLLWNSRNYDRGGGSGHGGVVVVPTSSDKAGFHVSFCAAETGFMTSTTAAYDAVPEASLMESGSQSDAAVLTLLFLGQLVSGIGSTALFSLGFTYMDDSVKKRNSPLYTGLTSALRCLGPVLGFLLASFCLGFNVKLTEKSQYTHSDPLFIGCWWLGFLLLGILQIAITFPMILFPKTLPSEKLLEAKNSIEKPKPEESAFKDLWKSLARIMRNPVVISYTISIGPAILGMIGAAMFMPKYLEAQFGQTPGRASVFSGVSTMLMLMTGTFAGGVVLWKFQPRTLYVTGFSCFIDVLHIIGTIVLMMLDCGKEEFAGVQLFNDGGFEVTSDCSRGCSCGLEFDPVCVGTTNFLSPCFAGCTAVDSTATQRTFLNCVCAVQPQVSGNIYPYSLNDSMAFGQWSTGLRGYCPGGRSECPYLWPYVLIKGASVLMGSLTRISFILILVRSVEKRDKSIVLALMMVVSSLTGFIPGPIVFGAAVDKTCLLWDEKSDGGRGNCWVYDTQAFSYWFHGLKILCYVITTIMSVFICYYARHVNLYDDDVDGDKNAVALKDQMNKLKDAKD